MHFTDETMNFLCIRQNSYLIPQKETDAMVGFLLRIKDALNIFSHR